MKINCNSTLKGFGIWSIGGFAFSNGILRFSFLIFAAAILAASAEREVRAEEKAVVSAVPVTEFSKSIGTMSAISRRGENLEKTIECCRYLGVSWLRAGIEGNVPIEEFARLHKEAGVKFSWGLGSGGSDLKKLLATGRAMAKAGALLAFEGPNEPNNWAVTYQGEKGGGNGSWMAVAKLQRDLYESVKQDAELKNYPVWSISEGGAEVDNVGLQFLTIPEGANALMPSGTRYADFANVHNYIYHPGWKEPGDNKAWNAADPTAACRVDGLYVEYGKTWARHFQGYSERELETLPRVTTETGATIGGEVTEELHAINLLTMYLDQFKRGWSYTAVYLLRDRVDEGGNQKFGFFRPDYTPRKAAVYLHNLTKILAENGPTPKPQTLNFSISPKVETNHDLLLQKSNGRLELVIWNEQLKGERELKVEFTRPFKEVLIYDPSTGTEPIQQLRNANTATLHVGNGVVVLEIDSE